MTSTPPGKITRGYAFGLISAVCILVAALLIAGWGLLSLFSAGSPVVSNIPTFVAPLLVMAALVLLVWVMWAQTIALLKGARPAWSLMIVVAGAAYLIWALGGTAAGMTVAETWLSPFAAMIFLIWPAGLFIFWSLLLRRLYSSKGPPKWPWEEREEEERRGKDLE